MLLTATMQDPHTSAVSPSNTGPQRALHDSLLRAEVSSTRDTLGRQPMYLYPKKVQHLQWPSPLEWKEVQNTIAAERVQDRTKTKHRYKTNSIFRTPKSILKDSSPEGGSLREITMWILTP